MASFDHTLRASAYCIQHVAMPLQGDVESVLAYPPFELTLNANWQVLNPSNICASTHLFHPVRACARLYGGKQCTCQDEWPPLVWYSKRPMLKDSSFESASEALVIAGYKDRLIVR